MIATIIRAALLALSLAPAHAGAFSLQWPVACSLGQDCFIQQYPDHDPGPGAVDFTCGPLSYDGHSGTDIALPDLAAMARGVDVRAAAPGRVQVLRDGMPDIALGAPGAPVLDRNECGNAVVLDHSGGWQTLYCHMRQGSVAVQQGQEVAAGTVLGQIGLSGQTEFPHLHLGLRRDGAVVDPFAPRPGEGCGAAETGPALWSQPVPYGPGGLIALGIASAVPEFEAVKAGLPALPRLTRDLPALVIWAHLYGTKAGDSLTFSLTGPGGGILSETVGLDRTQARAMRAVGRRMPPGGWPAGDYEARLTVMRSGMIKEHDSLFFTLRD
ncbi:M23 family metallopeptidase [Szabonella alba]|uniref:M23 family metallopeptidase n=1 Tax=Szabonella alba TaxID=2804194 RepID=A0A8K0VC19_9RHOB|nr:M23 family metallopeptidase [Szabonella alba]MBL4918941.1 M23 family metallopeptidase [Szabonella alba]